MNYVLSLLYCIFYGCSSFCFSLSIKWLVTLYHFNLTFILLLSESIINIAICLILGYRTHTSKETILYSLVYSVQMYCGMKGLQIINIPMYMTLRRTLILFVFLMQKELKFPQFIAVLLIATGAVIAGSEHLDENYLGYALIIITNLLNALTLHLGKQLHTKQNMTPLHLVFQNSCNQLPFYFIGAYLCGEMHELQNTLNNTFAIYLGTAACLGFLLNYSTNLCNMLNSPLAIAITHNFKDILITTSSILIFQDFKFDLQSIIGVSISYVGSTLYTILKLKDLSKQQKEQPVAEEPQEETQKLLQ